MYQVGRSEAGRPAYSPSVIPIHRADVAELGDLGDGPVSCSEAGCSPHLIAGQLRRLLSSPAFEASERNRRFLTYAVEEVLAGRAGRIKAYSIATIVFGRDPSFDPQTDAIVRIEAKRLRQALEHYYLTGGRDDPIRISIPKGAYSAQFELLSGKATPPPPRPRRPAVLVASFEAGDSGRESDILTKSFTRQLVVSLTRFTELSVYGPAAGSHDQAFETTAHNSVDYVLQGGVTIVGGHFAVEALLVDARSGRNLWAGSFERSAAPDTFIMARDEVANDIVGTLAEPFGVIFSDLVPEVAGNDLNRLDPVESVALYYHCCHSEDRQLQERVRLCLERAIIDAPEYAEAFACLSMSYSDAHSLESCRRQAHRDPLIRALALAKQAVDLAPQSSRSRQGLALALWGLGDEAGCIEELNIARSLNPGDIVILAELGLRKAFLGEWQEAVPTLEQAIARSPLLPRIYRIGLALHHLVQDRHHAALTEMRKIGAPTRLSQIIEAAAMAKLGLTDKAVALAASFAGTAILDELSHRHVHPDVIRQILLRLPDALGGVSR